MPSPLNIAARAILCELAADQLKSAARALRAANAPKAADYTRRALESAQGAARHAELRLTSEREKPAKGATRLQLQTFIWKAQIARNGL